MTGYRNLSTVEIENEVLRSRYAAIKKAASDLVNVVELYMKQQCLRSQLFNTKETLKKLLK
jgi:hypothetical protein